MLYDINHPGDCERTPLLLCSTAVHKFQGFGSRMFFLGRCLTEGLNTGRAVILTEELKSTLHMLEPFKSWSNCTLEDAKRNSLRKGVKIYAPMDAHDLAKSSDMPSVGALYAKSFSNRGYWWWKSQEITYSLRPRHETLESFQKHQKKFGWHSEQVAVFQIRRTDKIKGCEEVYGKIFFKLFFL